VNRTNAEERTLSLGSAGASHEFDLFEKSRIIGGISTSPWFNKSGSNNTGGQDRAAAELLWLTLWSGDEKRVHILTDRELAEGVLMRFSGAGFRKSIEIQHFEMTSNSFNVVGAL
jgi:hypothetical protein